MMLSAVMCLLITKKLLNFHSKAKLSVSESPSKQDPIIVVKGNCRICCLMDVLGYKSEFRASTRILLETQTEDILFKL